MSNGKMKVLLLVKLPLEFNKIFENRGFGLFSSLLYSWYLKEYNT